MSAMPMPVVTDLTQTVVAQIDLARRSGALQRIVIPPCPELLLRLQEAMQQTEPDLNEVARIAGCDVAMSATLIKQANNPIYAAGQPVQTIGQAMNRLGLDETARIMTSFLVRGAIRVPQAPQLQRFWERSAKRATAMAFLAEKFPGVSVDVAHTYGLFCHVGVAVLAQGVKGYVSTMVEAAARIDRSYIATENANHRTDHAVVGALTARVWALAPTVVAAIRLHHDLECMNEGSTESEICTLIAMGLLAEHYMRRHEALDPDADWKSHGECAQAWLHISGDDVLQWEEELHPLLDVV